MTSRNWIGFAAVALLSIGCAVDRPSSDDLGTSTETGDGDGDPTGDGDGDGDADCEPSGDAYADFGVQNLGVDQKLDLDLLCSFDSYYVITDQLLEFPRVTCDDFPEKILGALFFYIPEG